MNKLDDILKDSYFVALNSKDVSINRSNMPRLALQLARKQPQNWLASSHEFAALSSKEKLQMLVVFDAISFSYWNDEGMPKWTVDGLDGSYGLLHCLCKEHSASGRLLNARYLEDMDEATFGRITAANVPIPLLTQRAANLRKVGEVLGRTYDGHISNLLNDIIHTDRATCPYVRDRIIRDFGCFGDAANYMGRDIGFYKRAQVLTSDLEHYHGFLSERSKLTACADYKLPQILRHHGILQYSDDLDQQIDAKKPLNAGSEQEIEIRANTIVAVDELAELVSAKRPSYEPIDINDALWLLTQDKSTPMKPYHRVRTTAY